MIDIKSKKNLLLLLIPLLIVFLCLRTSEPAMVNAEPVSEEAEEGFEPSAMPEYEKIDPQHVKLIPEYTGGLKGWQIREERIPYECTDEEFSSIEKTAEKYLGVPYVYAGKSPLTGFDCSGFTIYVFRQCGIELKGSSAQELYDNSTVIEKEDVKAGDLVFFKEDPEGKVSHVGIYLGGGIMIHAGTEGICKADLSTEYWTKRFFAFGRLDK